MSERGSKQTASLISKPALADFKVGVDNVIFSVDTAQNRLLVLLVMRQDEPYGGFWSLPGTLVRQGETLEAAAYRVLSEKNSGPEPVPRAALHLRGAGSRSARKQRQLWRALPVGELLRLGPL